MVFTHNTLPETTRAQSIELLNRHLAAAIDLYGQVKHAHWNVRGPGFLSIHELFDKVAATVDADADQLAERVGSLGGITEISRGIDQQLWFVESHIAPQ